MMLLERLWNENLPYKRHNPDITLPKIVGYDAHVKGLVHPYHLYIPEGMTMYQSKKECDKRAFTEPEASRYVGMSRSFLRQARMNGDLSGRTPGPPWIRIGSRAIRYLKEDLDAWLEQFKPTAA